MRPQPWSECRRVKCQDSRIIKQCVRINVHKSIYLLSMVYSCCMDGCDLSVKHKGKRAAT